MDKINWKQKLSSRKFWVSVGGFVTALLLGFGVADSVAAEVVSIISSVGCLVAYVLSEGYVDANRVNGGAEDGNKDGDSE